jgi:CheY-like chemotaxis protein/HPt (histidine-containing phosphotransfer) domain-containing protein
MSQFNSEVINEMVQEATEMLDTAETSLLSLDKGEDFLKNYNSLFRVFHSLKGAAGMFEMTALKDHVHTLENLLQDCKARGKMDKSEIDYFLTGVDSLTSTLPPPPSVETTPEKAAANPPPPAPEPVSPQPPVQTPPQNTSPLPPTLSSFGLSYPGTVIVIDDEPEMVEIISEIVSEMGFKAVGYQNPEEAIKSLPSVHPDLILTDMMMPKMTGLDVLKYVEEYDPDLPLIMVSGRVTKENLVEAIKYGIYAVVEKPFKSTEITNICINAIKRYRVLKLLNRTINFMMYQFSSLDELLQESGKNDIRELMKSELSALIDQKLQMKAYSKKI